ncbi:MAG: methylated-DNA--[protein]-cysteine S-methyltransferase [Actinomycetales bacterium]|nr:methylated-DNA--[protein]-cysteine S-methyltransferase [Actinomycetales bacterium]
MTNVEPGLVGLRVPSPVGDWFFVAADRPNLLVVAVGLGDQSILSKLTARERASYAGVTAGPHGVAERARAYFDGDLTSWDGVACVQPGGPFRHRVWQRMREVPAGEVVGYGELAAAAGTPGAARAVGSACADNRVPLLVPCHRVVRAGGNLGNYFYGVDVKRWLLRHEGFAI